MVASRRVQINYREQRLGRYREVGRFSEGPLREVSLYSTVGGLI